MDMSDPITIMRRFVEDYQTNGDESVAEELLSPDFVDHTPFPGFGSTREDVKQLFRFLRSAFPDMRVEIIEQFADGDRVVTRKNFHATHLGQFGQFAPTGKQVTIRVVDIVRVSGGLMREHWNVVDSESLM